MATIGVVHGRFQIFHLDHLEMVLEAARRCDHLLIGITNPDPHLTKYNANDPKRSSPLANPLTFYERHGMIRAALLEAGLNRLDFDIMPFPINRPDVLFHYVPRYAIFYLTIYDTWGETKKQLLESLGCQIDVLWKRPSEAKKMCGREIRERIAMGQEWVSFVPRAVHAYMIEHGLAERIRQANQNE